MKNTIMTRHAAAQGEKKLTRGDIINMFIRSNFLLGSFNFERVQAMGYCFIMIPAIKRLYGPGAERNEALKRHLEWFNTQPFCTAPILGVTGAMEEEKANGANIDGSSISGVKVGLMGPFAGVGDPSFGGRFARFSRRWGLPWPWAEMCLARCSSFSLLTLFVWR